MLYAVYSLSLYIYIYICMCMCMCVYTYIYIYIYIYICYSNLLPLGQQEAARGGGRRGRDPGAGGPAARGEIQYFARGEIQHFV